MLSCVHAKSVGQTSVTSYIHCAMGLPTGEKCQRYAILCVQGRSHDTMALDMHLLWSSTWLNKYNKKVLL